MAYLNLPAALKARGLTVETVPGWETRSNGYDLRAKAAVCHWTAGPAGSKTRPSLNIVVNGRSDLPGPLANVYLDRNGVAVVVSARSANHAGAGSWKGATGNSQVFGTECEAAGPTDFTDAQRAAYPRVNAAFCDLGGFGADMICGHSEWAGPRKTDINGYTMDQMRAQVAALLAGNPEDLDMDAATLKKAVWEVLMQDDIRERLGLSPVRPIYDTLTPGVVGVKNDGQVWALVRDTAARTAALQETVKALAAANGTDIDVDALLARVDQTVREALAESTVNVDVNVAGRTA